MKHATFFCLPELDNRLLGNWYWENDVEVMPCATWWNEYSLEHCLDGLPRRSLIEVSNVNTCHTPESERVFEMGLNKVSPTFHVRLGGELFSRRNAA